MDDIKTEEQGDAEAGFLHGVLLHLTDTVDTHQTEEAAHLAVEESLVFNSFLAHTGVQLSGIKQVELSDFLFDGHTRHQVADKRVFTQCDFLGLLGPTGYWQHKGNGQCQKCFSHIG